MKKKSITMTSLLLFITDGFENQISRNYKPKSIEDRILDRLVKNTDKGRRINRRSLSTSVGGILTLDSQANDEIYIANGWAEPRLSFIMQLRYDDRHTERYQILTGYTDRADLSYSGKIDPELEFYINNSISGALVETRTPGRGRSTKRIQTSNSLILRRSDEDDDRDSGRRRRRSDNREVSLRAEDVFYKLSSSSTTSNTFSETNETRVSMPRGTEFKTARRRETNISDYLSGLLRTSVNTRVVYEESDGYFGDINKKTATRYSDIENDMEYTESIYEHAGETVSDDFTEEGIFAQWMMEVDFTKTGRITWDEIIRSIDFDCRPTFVTAGQVDGRKIERRRAGDFEEWGGSRRVDIIPDIIKGSVTAIMLTHLVGSADIDITNDTLDGELNVEIFNMKSVIPDLDCDDFHDAVVQRIEEELGPILSREGHDLVDIYVRYRLISGMEIEISVNGSEKVNYHAAIHCDGLISPLRTSDESILDTLAEDTKDITSYLIDSRHEG